MNSLHHLLLAALRQHVLMHMIDNPLFTSEQQQQAAARVAACCNERTLSRWIAEARQEAHSRRVCRAVAQEVKREQAAVAHYVQDEAGRVLLLPARQPLQRGQTIRFALNQN